MKRAALVLALVACGGGSGPHRPRGGEAYTGPIAGELEPEPPPPYSTADLQKTLIAERGAEAKAERELAELELSNIPIDPVRLIRAKGDLAIRRRFISVLEVCEVVGRLCPPRLDEPALISVPDSAGEPALESPLRFDVTGWQKVAAELHGKACGCRTGECIESLDAAIDRLEQRPMADVQADETASESITKARECLFRLRGKRSLPRIARDTTSE